MADDEQPPAAPAPAQQPRRKGRRRRRLSPVLTVILVTQLVVAMLTATTVYAFVRQLDDALPPGVEIPHVEGEKPEVEGPKEPLNILVMGSDTRTGEGNQIDGESGSDGSDTTMLLHVSADRKEAYGVSLPRDAIVDRPDCVDEDGRDVPGADDVMFNTAFSVGGPLCTIQMVETLTGVYVDHFIVLDFHGFKAMVDAVDGVQVCLPKEVDDPEHGIYLPAGTHELTGQQALNYVRERYTLSVTGDIGRMKRQQAFVASMINKVLSANTLSQPTKVRNFLKAVVGSIQVDDELDRVKDLADLAMQFRETGLSNIKFITVPIEEYPLDPNRLQWTTDADRLWKRIIADAPLGRTFSGGSISAAKPPTSESPSTSPDASPDTGASATPEQEEQAETARAEALANGLCA
ncbi:LCP family protein [Nocardioides lianchengensis]|uniref:LCP family protein n=1 Tax=Nocardioides lianchengensis TaxID=1045774 RepID=UPI0017905CB6|nr:LCP family protein [Nocardioides lianchengensis]NYG10783.1 LCP family protein required for cell wall assembly [Nocardioides lianchengensis]